MTENVMENKYHSLLSLMIANKTYSSYRVRTKVTLFCHYCGIAKRTDRMKDHCNDDHNAGFRFLEYDTMPIYPQYKNWRDFIYGFPNVAPIKDK